MIQFASLALNSQYSISRFSFREIKTGKALLSRMAKIKPNEKKSRKTDIQKCRKQVNESTQN